METVEINSISDILEREIFPFLARLPKNKTQGKASIMPTEEELAMLPPMLRMAATSSSGKTPKRPGRPARPPAVRLPGKTKSFQIRREQVDALQKIRCGPRTDMATEDEQRKQTLLRRENNKARLREQEEEAERQAAAKKQLGSSSHHTNDDTPHILTSPTAPPKGKLGWERESPSPGTVRGTLQQEAQAMKQRVAQLELEASATSTGAAAPKHSRSILEKKLDKVTKLLQNETPGTKEYKKLAKKQEQYETELDEWDAAAQQEEARQDALEQAKQEVTQAEAKARLALQEEERARREREEAQAIAKEESDGEEAIHHESAMAEEARKLKERAEALKAKRAEASPPPQSPKKAPPSTPAPMSPPEVLDEREQKRQDAISEYRRKQAEKKEEEEVAKQKAERTKEFKILKKKLSKLESMIEDAEETGKNTAKLLKKQHEYISQLEEYDEWEEELEQRRQAEEEARLQKEREEAERQRQERLEVARQRRAEEEAARRKEEEEAARIEQERRELEEEEERERLRLEREEEEERLAEEAERRRQREEEEEEQRRIEEERREIREAQEAVERAAREEELAKEREEQERIRAEQRQREEEKQALRREEMHEQTRAAEAEAAANPSTPVAAAEPSREFIDVRSIPEPHSANTKKILSELEALEERQGRLEKTLKQNGIAVVEDIPYEVAKDKIAELQEQMKALATSEEDQFVVQKKYYALEEEMSKYVTAMMLTDEFVEEQRMAESKWEESVEADNITALRKVRRHMPVNIRNMTEEELTSNPTPNGKMLPKAMAKKFKRTNALQLIRVNPTDLERMHPSLVEGLRTTGLTLTERRALHEHLKDIGSKWQELQQDPSIERKYSWFLALKSKFKEMVTSYDKHVKEFGPPGNHPYAKRNDPPGSGCTLLGNQCPIKADSVVSYEEDYGYTSEAEYEGGMPAPAKNVAKSKTSSNSAGAKKKDDEIMASIRERLHLTGTESTVDTKLLRELFFAEKRALNLEKQLAQNGLALPKEDIPFAVAKAKVAEITEEIKVVAVKMGETTDLKEMTALEKEYSQLSDDLEKYNNALMLTKEWAQELLEKERQWEERVRPANQEALRKIRRHMPVNIKDLSEQDMIEGTTPNGKQLPQKIVRKFKRTNILQLVRMPQSMIEPMHPSSLEGMRSTGLTLTERRALHEHLKDLGAKWKASSNDKMAERKWMWHESLRGKFRELVDKYDKHVEEYGPPHNHPYAERGEPGGGCPLLGKQCPVKADQEVHYDEDYGFPPDAIYNIEKVKKSNLLTVEELERRKQDDEWGYDAPVAEEEETPSVPTAGLMAAIGARGGDITSEEAGQRPQGGGGLLAAIASKGSESMPKPTGLLAAIQSKGEGTDEGDTDTAPSKGEANVAPISPTKKKRLGGLLSAIAGRGKKG